ncbi:MAG: hypothetical protein Q4D04_14655, partial [Clostridia bacterium]|nr:hypothetical protein [Clostridia bacterium]
MLYPASGIHLLLPGRIDKAYSNLSGTNFLAFSNDTTLYSRDLIHWHQMSQGIRGCDGLSPVALTQHRASFPNGTLIIYSPQKSVQRLSLPYVEIKDGVLSISPACRRLRVWERRCRYQSIDKSFSIDAAFSVYPLSWPDIELTPPDGSQAEVSSSNLEIILSLDVGREKVVRMTLLGVEIVYDAKMALLHIEDKHIPMASDDGLIRLHCMIDDFAMEILVMGRLYCVYPFRREPCIRFETEGDTACVAELKLYGLRDAGYSPELIRQIQAIPPGSPVFKSDAFNIFTNKVKDIAYSEPDAYVPDRSTVISPTRVVEEFSWRHTPWGDMTRVINRKSIWSAPNALERFPDIHTGITTFDAACRIALDVLNNATDPRFALDGEAGMWSAGAFQGEGLGFGVWRRDSAQIIMKCGSMIEPAVSANTLQYILSGGFDNGIDGIPMPVMALGDYFKASGDLALLRRVWPRILEAMRRADGLFCPEKGLYHAPQSSSNDAFDEPEAGGFALSTQVYFMAAYEAAADMARALKEDALICYRWLQRSHLLRESIREAYWNPDYGYYTSGPRGSESYDKGYWE